MIDKTEDIKAFFRENYLPSTINESEEDLQLNSAQVLEMLFSVFPEGCIDTYDLHQILTSLGYTPQKKAATIFVWCFESV